MDSTYISVAHASVPEWIDQLAGPTPDPGGGAGAAVVMALGVATGQMALGYAAESAERDRFAAVLAAARAEAIILADTDAAASAALSAAYRSQDQNSAAVRVDTLAAAARSSIAVAQLAQPVLPVLEWLVVHGETRLMPDVAVAAHLMAAAVRASVVNLDANVAATSAACQEAGIADATSDMRSSSTDAVRLAENLGRVAEMTSRPR